MWVWATIQHKGLLCIHAQNVCTCHLDQLLNIAAAQVVSHEARARSQRMTEAAAARIAELEDQVERQQRALRYCSYINHHYNAGVIALPWS